MFFLKKNSWSGQVFPILLICIAGVVVAVFATKIIGDSYIAQTAASNAADSGSLSTASCWAGSLNRLVYRNWDKDSEERSNGAGHEGTYMGYSTVPDNSYYYYKEMNYYYKNEGVDDAPGTGMRNIYELVYNDGVMYIEEARELATVALGLCVEAQGLWELGEECEIWANFKTISEKLDAAALELEQAAFAVGAFHVDTYYMRAIGDWFWNNQQEHLCKAIAFMNENYKRAIRTGQFYALSNSSYQASDPDDFNFWLGGGGGSNFNPGASNTVSYPPGGGEGSVSVTVKTPTISNYIIRMAEWNYVRKHGFKTVPFPCLRINSVEYAGDVWAVASSKALSTDLRTVVAGLKTYAQWAMSVYNITKDAAENCWECIGCGNPHGCRIPCAPPKYTQATNTANLLKIGIDCVVTGLNTIVYEASGGVGADMGKDTIPRLANWNNWIWTYFWSENDVEWPAKTCWDVRKYCDANCEKKGMNIKNIREVVLSGEWEVECEITSEAAKKSKSKFWGDKGGRGLSVGDTGGHPFYDDYYPEITGI